ncbi:MAG: hypothetical protein M1120_01240 [Patescibacteria group bacterium]|nr:hypothetical protein [Patescibacteria group bacterium]
MKKTAQKNPNPNRFMQLLAKNSGEQRLLFGLQLSEFVNKLHKQGLPKEISLKFFLDESFSKQEK